MAGKKLNASLRGKGQTENQINSNIETLTDEILIDKHQEIFLDVIQYLTFSLKLMSAA